MKHNNVGPIFSVANQKGGVGKTTTSINLAASLAALDKRVLVLDLDPQCNTTSGLGVDKDSVALGMYDLLSGGSTLDDVIMETDFEGLHLVPSTMDLSGAEVELVNLQSREHVLHHLFESYQGEPFDYVIIDCPPALNMLTVNALAASDKVIVTLQTEFYAMEGLSQLMDTIRRVRANFNEDLEVEGIVLTMVDRRNNLSVQVEKDVREYFGAQVYESVIPRNVRLSEAPSYGVPVMYHDLRSKGAQAYLQMAQELTQREAFVA
ncbi:MAG: ParA family protein [Ghiorsea sp.]|nr:ParA family protein [Ghiorsea sp.]